MEKRSVAVVVLIVTAFFALAGMAVSRMIRDGAPEREKQLTQQQRLNTLEKLSPQSSSARKMVAAEKANEVARKEVEQSDK